MIVNLKTLLNYIDLTGITPEEIKDKLTFAGVEVEAMKPVATASNIVVGEVLTATPIEGTHLHFCKVNAGVKHGVLPIICGAPNVRPKMKAIVALPGAVLADDFKIKKAVIKGYESGGMLCSLLELGVDKNYLSDAQKAGIEELPEDSQIGDENVLQLLELDDVIFELSVLPNRPDILGVYYIAKELGTLFNRPVKELVLPEVERLDFILKTGIETQKSLHFSTQIVKNVKIGPSPKWLQTTLVRLGYKPFNNIVDISNYVMAVLNQPIHMYDLDKLPAKELVIEDNFEGEVITLDEAKQEVKLGDICVSSNHIPQCLGGVMGLLNSSVQDETKNLVIEVATFDPTSVRKTAKRMNLVSESSLRNAKGNNPYNHQTVIKMIDALIHEMNPGAIFGKVETVSKIKPYDNLIKVDAEYINKRLGTKLTIEEIETTLKRSYCQTKLVGGTLEVVPPTYRLDLKDKVDLSEEVIRLLGFEILEDVTLQVNVKTGGLNQNQLAVNAIREMLLGQGLDEIITYSLVSEAEVLKTNSDTTNIHELVYPLSDNRRFMRSSLLPSLFEVASYNNAHQVRDLAVFEISDLYVKSGKVKNLGIILSGHASIQDLMRVQDYSFYHLKGIIEALLEMHNIQPNRVKMEKLSPEDNIFNYAKAVKVTIDKKPFGVFGELHPYIIKEYKLVPRSLALEVSLSVLESINTAEPVFTPMSRFPMVERDLAFYLDNEIEIGAVEREIKRLGGKLLRELHIFDVFYTPESRKSVAFRLYYVHEDHTLTDAEIKEVEKNIIDGVSKKFNAILRDGTN